MELTPSFRDLEPADLSDLDWSGGPEHIRAVAVALEASYADEVALVVGCLPNDRLIAMGGVDFRPSEDAGNIWMLAVHERFQSLGAGAELIAALERKIIDHGRPLARMLVEHDNPRARALYERLGYRTLVHLPGYYQGIEAALRMGRDLSRRPVDHRICCPGSKSNGVHSMDSEGGS